jgi:hypothetical protein
VGGTLMKWALALALLTGASWARAADDPDAFARVTSEETELRTGPGASYRVLHVGHRGETYPVEGRRDGLWLHVVLPDGRDAYVLGDTVQSFTADPRTGEVPRKPGFFAPPPLKDARGGLAILGGVLRAPVEPSGHDVFGYLEVRPSIVVHENVSLDAFAGAGMTSAGTQFLYGGGATVHFAPDFFLCPYASLGVGGLSTVPNADTFVLERRDVVAARANAGLLFALRGRILVRLDASNLALFRADSLQHAQTFSGGLGVYF